MAKIYLASSGEYSDYRVHAAFSIRPLADAYIAANLFHGVQMEIEERELDPVTPAHETADKYWCLWMYKDGDVHEVREVAKYDIDDQGVPSTIPMARHSRVGFTTGYRQGDSEGVLWMEVIAPTKEHAIKIANDKRVRLIAANLWPAKESVYESDKRNREAITSA